MRRNFVIVCSVLVLSTVLVGCDKEVKPDKPGVFVVTGKTLTPWPPVAMQEEFTPEGFLTSFFYEDPAIVFKARESHMVFNGDYRPYAMRQFVKSEGRWVEDSSKPVGKDVFEVGQMKGEKSMFKGKVIKELKPGVYVLDVQRGTGKSESFSFRVP